MKLLTLNTHSLAEPDYERKLTLFAELIKRERPDVFALQEVNQTAGGECLKGGEDTGYVPCRGVGKTLKKDNHGYRLARILKESGCAYQWTWVPVKLGYGIYEEGLALFSALPIQDTRQFFISCSQEFSNWKTRKALGIQVAGCWYFSVHMGWWEDEEEPFALHWDQAVRQIRNLAKEGETAWVMGDFNSPSSRQGEGYDYVRSSGWWDTYELAEEKDEGITVKGGIDGWKEGEKGQKRIDYIWCSQEEKVHSSKVVCNGVESPVVSDHYGVMVRIEEKG